MLLRTVCAVAVCVLLAGCMATTETRWEKPGATQADFHQDRGQCMERVFSATFASPYQQQGIYISCMAGKGWYTREVPK